MCYFLHMKGTTGLHRKQRREKVYSKRCAQCSKTLTKEDHVAAHVYTYGCGCVPIGATLRTTCKTCNHYKNSRRGFWGCKFRIRRLPK